MFEILTRRFERVNGKIPFNKLGYWIPEKIRTKLIDSLRTHHERILLRNRATVMKWDNLCLETPVPTSELLARPGYYGKPEIVYGGLNGIVDTGEDYLIYGMTGLTTGGGLPVTDVAQYDNANAYLGVGDSVTAWAAAQTDLQAGTNKDRNGMEATYPLVSTAQQVIFRSQWGTAEANFVWAEWGLFNDAVTADMFSRKVEALGTKATGSTWTLTATMDFTSVGVA